MWNLGFKQRNCFAEIAVKCGQLKLHNAWQSPAERITFMWEESKPLMWEPVHNRVHLMFGNLIEVGKTVEQWETSGLMKERLYVICIHLKRLIQAYLHYPDLFRWWINQNFSGKSSIHTCLVNQLHCIVDAVKPKAWGGGVQVTMRDWTYQDLLHKPLDWKGSRKRIG